MDGGQTPTEDGEIKQRQRGADHELTSFNEMAQALDRPWRLVRARDRGFVLMHHPVSEGREVLLDLREARSAFEAVQKSSAFLTERFRE